jgi:hypothetical protein
MSIARYSVATDDKAAALVLDKALARDELVEPIDRTLRQTTGKTKGRKP